VNLPFICSNIPAAPAYGVYISQLIRYSRACGSYHDLLDRGLLLTRKLLNLEAMEEMSEVYFFLSPSLLPPIKKSLKIPKGQSESVYRRRTDNTMAKRKGTKGQTTINKTYI
jgi:hypothetical protein